MDNNNNIFDLMTTVEYGGCSAKIPAAVLEKVLLNLPRSTDKNILVDIDTHDDAGVYRISDDLLYALIPLNLGRLLQQTLLAMFTQWEESPLWRLT